MGTGVECPPIFNHLIDAPSCRLLIGTHYADYHTPVLRASPSATHHCRSGPVVLERGRLHTIVVFWRVVGPMREMGIYLDGRLVGHLWEPARPVVTWRGDVWIGMRAGGEPVGDPSFPGKAEADGRLSVAVFTADRL